MATYCCDDMRVHVEPDCDVHGPDDECSDRLVVHVAKFREYGLPMGDGGQSYAVINYCPWCGSTLPSSVREAWFERLESLGIDPGGDAVPAEFEDDRWLNANGA